MSAGQTTLALFCVLLIAVGQLLFKLVGKVSVETQVTGLRTMAIGGCALFLYGVATILWIYLLRSAELSKAYPWMALSYVLVAGGSVVFFRESISWTYAAGLLLIIAGVLVISRSA